MLNILDGIGETLQAHTHGYRTPPPQLGQGGTYWNRPRGMSVERERVETCRNKAKRESARVRLKFLRSEIMAGMGSS